MADLKRIRTINAVYYALNGKDLSEFEGASSFGGADNMLKSFSDKQVNDMIQKYYANPTNPGMAALSLTTRALEKEGQDPTDKKNWGDINEIWQKYNVSETKRLNSGNESELTGKTLGYTKPKPTPTPIDYGTELPTAGGTTPTPATGGDIDATVAQSPTEDWQKFYTAPSKFDVAAAYNANKILLKDSGISDAEILQFTKDNLVTQSTELAKSKWDTSATQGKIDKSIADYPEQYKQTEADIFKRLSGYGAETFEKEIIPAVSRSYASMGRLGGGGLTEALARESGKINRGISEMLAPQAINAFQTGQGMNVANLQNIAQQQGITSQNVDQWLKGLYGQSYGTLGNVAQQNLGAQLQKQLAGYTSGLNTQSQKQLMDYQNQLSSDMYNQQAQGGLGGLLLSTLLGGGIGGLAGIGTGKGALMGLTGKYF